MLKGFGIVLAVFALLCLAIAAEVHGKRRARATVRDAVRWAEDQ